MGLEERTCLIVDDEPSIRAYLKTILESAQYHPLEAGSVTEAFRTVNERQGAVDLILTDLRMPVGYGRS